MLQPVHSTSVKNILVVDRRRADATQLTLEFPKEEYIFTVAQGIEEAMDLARRNDFDAALIDVDLPTRHDSFGLLRAILRERPATKIIMMTDYGDEELWIDALNEGACDLVAKPVHLRDVERRLA